MFAVIDTIVTLSLLAIVAVGWYVWKHRKRSKPRRWYINSAKEQSRRLGVRRAEEREFGRRPVWKPVTINSKATTMFNRRSQIIGSFISVALMAAAGNTQAVQAKTAMEADLAAKGMNINDLANQGRKGHARPGPSGAAAAKRAARKRRNVRARASKRA